MNEGNRLTYHVPGYTGHLPKNVYDTGVQVENNKEKSHIPGYAGYVKGIKSQNIYGSTFGKVTQSINKNDFIKGQDFEPKNKYVTTATLSNISPSQTLSKTAADIVGIPRKQIKIRQPKIQQGLETNQFTIVKDQSFKQKMKNNACNKSDAKKDPLPGYTGFMRRVNAGNIYGQTFAKCKHDSQLNANELDHQKKLNFNKELQSDVPVKF